MTEEQKKIVLQQRAGFAMLTTLNLDDERRMTFADRLDAFLRIQSISPFVRTPDSRSEDDMVTQKWTKILAAYDASHR